MLDESEEWAYEGELNGTQVRVSVDCSASHLFMSVSAARRCGLTIFEDSSEVELGDRSIVTVYGRSTGSLTVGETRGEKEIFVDPESGQKQEDKLPTVIVGRKWLRKHNPDIDWRTGFLAVKRPDGSQWIVKPKVYRKQREVVCKRMSFKKMVKLVKKKKCELYAVQLRPEITKMKVSEKFSELVDEFADVFKEELPRELPPKRDVEFEIKLHSYESPPVRPVIRLSTEELKELKRQLQSLLDKKILRPSTSPYGAPVFFVKKKNGELRMVCDYRGLNKITISDSNPLPLINEALDQVGGACVFSQIDLVGAYHQMRIKDEDCHKTAIRTRYGSFEWRVLCFGLTNAPASFSRLMTGLLHELNGECLVMFLDDVLVYSRSIEEHKEHLRKLFTILWDNKLYAKPSKCVIGVDEVDFLGFKVNKKGVQMQKLLMDSILEWPVPASVKDVQRFVGLANYYRRFIKGYADLLRPVSDILRKKEFMWGQEQQEAFESVRQALTSAPVLEHASADKTFVVSTDASKFAVGATLEQDGHPVAFLSHRLSET